MFRLLNKALRDTDPCVKEIELLDGSFKAVPSNDTHRDVVCLDDDALEMTYCQVPSGSEVCSHRRHTRLSSRAGSRIHRVGIGAG